MGAHGEYKLLMHMEALLIVALPLESWALMYPLPAVSQSLPVLRHTSYKQNRKPDM